jgi:hypothetical protein
MGERCLAPLEGQMLEDSDCQDSDRCGALRPCWLTAEHAAAYGALSIGTSDPQNAAPLCRRGQSTLSMVRALPRRTLSSRSYTPRRRILFPLRVPKLFFIHFYSRKSENIDEGICSVLNTASTTHSKSDTWSQHETALSLWGERLRNSRRRSYPPAQHHTAPSCQSDGKGCQVSRRARRAPGSDRCRRVTHG